jgi:hypothetical protein
MMSKKLVNYLTLACTGTGQATFYNSRQDQETALEASHMEVLQSDRRVYALSAALPINDKSKQLVLENLLSTGKQTEDSELESNVIGMVVSEMQFNRVLNLFIALYKKKINNFRVRKLGQGIWDQIDAYRAIKYAGKVRIVLRHCHIPEGNDPVKAEIHKWLFGKIKKVEDLHYNPKLVSRIKAKTDYAAVMDLPYDIAKDIAISVHKKKPEDFDREFAGKDKTKTLEGEPEQKAKGTATRKEALRIRKTTGDTAIDFSRFSIFELLMHGHKNEGDVGLIQPYLKQKAREIAQYIKLPAKVAVVVDNSISALGSAERRYLPLANMEAALRIFKETAETELKTFFVGPDLEEDKLLKAEGSTNLRRPLVNALLWRPNVVVILSDGYENVRAGSVNQILSSKAVKGSGIHVMHLNPVAAAESGKTRELSTSAITFALPAPEQLPMIALIGIAAANPKMLEPMFMQVEKRLKAGDYRGARLAVRSAAPSVTIGATEVAEAVS